MMTKDEALKLALEALERFEGNKKLWPEVIDAIKESLAQPEQEPVARVIEELEHDGQGWCSKVRWLYNPVPVGETLFWKQPK